MTFLLQELDRSVQQDSIHPEFQRDPIQIHFKVTIAEPLLVQPVESLEDCLP